MVRVWARVRLSVMVMVSLGLELVAKWLHSRINILVFMLNTLYIVCFVLTIQYLINYYDYIFKLFSGVTKNNMS